MVLIKQTTYLSIEAQILKGQQIKFARHLLKIADMNNATYLNFFAISIP